MASGSAVTDFDALLQQVGASFEPPKFTTEEEGLGALGVAAEIVMKQAQKAGHVEKTLFPCALPFLHEAQRLEDVLERQAAGAGAAFLGQSMTLIIDGQPTTVTIREGKKLIEEQVGEYLVASEPLVRKAAIRGYVRFHMRPDESLTWEEFLDRFLHLVEKGYFDEDEEGPLKVWDKRYSLGGERLGFCLEKGEGFSEKDVQELIEMVKAHLRRFARERREEAKAEAEKTEDEVNVTPLEVWNEGKEGMFLLDVPPDGRYSPFTLFARSQWIEAIDEEEREVEVQVIRPVRAIGSGGSLNTAAGNEDIYVELESLKHDEGRIFTVDEMPFISPPRDMSRPDFANWWRAVIFLWHALRRALDPVTKAPEGEIPPWSFVVCGREGVSTLTFEGEFKWTYQETVTINDLSLRWKRRKEGDQSLLSLVEVVTDDEGARNVFQGILGKEYPEKTKYAGIPHAGGVFLRICFSQMTSTSTSTSGNGNGDGTGNGNADNGK